MSDDVELPGDVRYHPETLKRLERERDEAVAQRNYWKNELLSEQADYDKARKERDALREALIRASQRLGDLGANVPEPSRRTIAEVVADISQALAAVEEGKVS